jgi:hypothetical protein
MISTANVKIPHGDVKITLKHTMKEPKLNGPSTVEFFINDEKVGEMDITATVYAAYTGHETFDIGRDEGLPVNEEYADRVNSIYRRAIAQGRVRHQESRRAGSEMPPSTALLTRLIIHLKKAARAVAAIRWPHPCGPYPRCTGRRIPPGGENYGHDI